MILVIAHVADGKVSPTTKEALGAAHKLSQSGPAEVTAPVIGANMQVLVEGLIAAGAGTVFSLEEPALATYKPDAYARIAEKAVVASKASIVLMAHNDAAKDLAPKLAFRLQAGLTRDCVALAMNGD